MPHAELHGKISRSGSNLSDGLEDLLTSDLFGRLRYLAPQQGLALLLRAARSFETERPGVALPGEVTGAAYRFWPPYRRSEPDVAIDLETTGGPAVLFVECKYRSGKSGEDDPTAADTPGRKMSDQLAREFSDLKEEHGASTALLYVTGHRTMPRDELERSALSLGHDGAAFRAQTYWIGWHTVREVLAASLKGMSGRDALILEDLVALLDHKGFRSFAGWPKPETKEGVTVSDTRSRAEAVRAAFDYVSRVYGESAYLLRDFQHRMDAAGFDPVRTDNGSEHSYRLDAPAWWMPQYLSMYWLQRGGSPSTGYRKVYAGLTVAFFTPQGRAIQPVLVYGVARSMDHPQAGDARAWLWYAATGHENAFTYTQDGKAQERPPVETPGALVRFECSFDDTSYFWPKAGYLKVVDLMELASADTVAAIAEELRALWARFAGNLAG
jgi:hypothetical protein